MSCLCLLDSRASCLCLGGSCRSWTAIKSRAQSVLHSIQCVSKGCCCEFLACQQANVCGPQGAQRAGLQHCRLLPAFHAAGQSAVQESVASTLLQPAITAETGRASDVRGVYSRGLWTLPATTGCALQHCSQLSVSLSAVHDAVKGAVGHAVDHAEAKSSSGHQETVREVGAPCVGGACCSPRRLCACVSTWGAMRASLHGGITDSTVGVQGRSGASLH